MLLLLSPAKSLNFDKPAKDVVHTHPLFVKQAAELMNLLKPKSPQEIASLMHVSDILAFRTVAYCAAWQSQSTCDNAAVLAFNGNVYRGLDAQSLGTDELAWIQNHVCILSGLYGVLRPLDRIQPYRLEMGTPLPNSLGKNLYEFWGTQISEYVNQRLKKDPDPVLINLASVEYFKAVDTQAQKARVVNCVFEDFKDGRYKIISIHAKRARGLMARFAAMHHVTHPEQLQDFDAEGYAFDPAASGLDRLVFRRRSSG